MRIIRPVANTAVPAIGRRTALLSLMRISVIVTLVVAAENASAAAIDGVGTALRLLTPLVLVILFRGRPSQLLAGNLPAVGALAVIALGAALMWRARNAVWWRRSDPTRRRSDAEPPLVSAFGTGAVELPPHLDRGLLHAELRRHFFALQAAWDGSERMALSRLTTPTMLEELHAARAAGAGMAHRTEVRGLDLQVLAFEAVHHAEVAYVEFFGTVRESGSSHDAPFRELWMLTREHGTAASGPWRLARHQALL